MSTFTSIENQVLSKITPTETDRKQLQETISSLKYQVKRALSDKRQHVTIELVGSTAKDTFLRNNLDIDLFIIYPPTTPEQSMAQQTLSIGRKILAHPEECYAEHPYIRGDFYHYKVELVPCYQISDASEKISAVDRTPLHTAYIKKHLLESQKKEVRLLKQFLRGIHCYGAEAEIQGFSGYLCELLILKFNTFHQLLSKAQHWKKGTELTLTKHPIPSFSDPLVFIDPIDKDRNVAAAIAPDTFEQFIIACKSYLDTPKITFFFPQPIQPWSLKKITEQIEKQHVMYIGIRFNKPDIISENLYPQLRKACNAIKQASSTEGFTIYDIQFYIDEDDKLVYLIIKTDEKPLPNTFTHKGPPINLKENTKEFIEKWKNHPLTVKGPFQQNNRTYVTVKRTYRHLHNYLKDNLKELSLGKHIDTTMNDNYTILSQSDLINKHLATFWTQYLDEKNPWER